MCCRFAPACAQASLQAIASLFAIRKFSLSRWFHSFLLPLALLYYSNLLLCRPLFAKYIWEPSYRNFRINWPTRQQFMANFAVIRLVTGYPLGPLLSVQVQRNASQQLLADRFNERFKKAKSPKWLSRLVTHERTCWLSELCPGRSADLDLDPVRWVRSSRASHLNRSPLPISRLLIVSVSSDFIGRLTRLRLFTRANQTLIVKSRSVG